MVLAIGIGLLSYSYVTHKLSQAEKSYNHSNYEVADSIHLDLKKNLEKWPLSKIWFLQREIEKIDLIRAWSFYCQGYYNSEKYELAEEIASQALDKNKLNNRDQFYNLKTLIYWQKAVDLFIKLGKKAIDSKELNRFFEKAKESSAEAVKVNNGKDWDIKYNYEFFRQTKEKLTKSMQSKANKKKEDRESRKKLKQMAKEKKIKSNQKERGKIKSKKMQEQKKDGKKKKREKILTLENESGKPKKNLSDFNKKKKKKKKKG